MLKELFIELLNEEIIRGLNIHSKYIDDLKKELAKFNSDEELLRGGGISIETLDRLAFGFSSEDIKTINPNDLKLTYSHG